MKGLFYVLVLSIVSTFAFSQGGYRISIKIDHIQDTTLYLGYHFGNQKFLTDTAKVLDETALFEGTEPLQPGIYFVYNPNTYFEFVVAEQHFSLETDTSDYLGNLKVNGSMENELFKLFHTNMREQQEKIAELKNALELAGSSQDSAEIRLKMTGIGDEIEDYRKKLIKKYPEAYFTKVLKAMEKPEIPAEIGEGLDEEEKRLAQFEYYRRHFFDNIDFGSEDLLRTPVIHPKIMEYMDNLVNPHPDSLKMAAEALIEQSKGNDAFFRYLLVTLTSKYERSHIMGQDAVFVHLAEKYYLSGEADWITGETREKFAKRVEEIKPTLIGKPAPPFVLMDTLQARFALYDLDSKYTVLYFYDPDCGHCRKKTPVLHDMYYDLKALGAEVLAINIQTDVDKWKNYIKKNGLSWINLADPFVRSNFRKEYNINSTPKVFILDADKKVIAKKIGVEQVMEIIELQERRSGS